MRTHLRLLVALLAATISVSAVSAETKLPSIFTNNMVLQREAPIPFWGWDKPGNKVTVSIGEASQSAEADKEGRWMVKLPAMKAGGPHTVKVVGSSTHSYKNVLVGEVWLCSGQSNMEWRVSQSKDAKKEIASANHPMIRHIKYPHQTSTKPETNNRSQGGWQVCSPKTVASFTAVGYYFGRHLHKELKVPIGLIGSNWGGTRIEPWTPPEGFKAIPELKKIADNLPNLPGPRAARTSPLAIYNAMIHPLVPYNLRGAIWYQGESNNGEGMQYYHKMRALIHGWRTIWNKPEMPFYFVHLAPFRYGRRSPQALPGIWQAQIKALSIPHTGMAVTSDIGNVRDIHPKNKQDVGKRLALNALAKTYGQKDLVYSGPIFKSAKVEGNKVVVSFDHVGGGLVSRDGEALTNFELAGADGKFVKAVASIDGDNVVVSADGVAKPTALRFGWDDRAEPNLSNKAGLPTPPGWSVKLK